ncbi:MAG TPA: DUF4388 domain-containing protein [Acidobacteria bacterium]|nr:DUF4388 domain-containing protein [Acidobacteriota bacterium]
MCPTTTRPTLAFAGRLEGISLAEVLQILGATRRSGLLQVEQEDPPERGEIEMEDGRIVRASRSPVPEPLGAVLLRRRAVDPQVLGQALERQAAVAPWKPLGTVLLEMGALEPGDLAESLAEQIEEAVAVILSWRSGVFRFRTPAPRHSQPGQTLLGVALDTQQTLLEAARRWDEDIQREGVLH